MSNRFVSLGEYAYRNYARINRLTSAHRPAIATPNYLYYTDNPPRFGTLKTNKRSKNRKILIMEEGFMFCL